MKLLEYYWAGVFVGGFVGLVVGFLVGMLFLRYARNQDRKLWDLSQQVLREALHAEHDETYGIPPTKELKSASKSDD